MTDELATLYLDYEGQRYRIKVFQNTVGIERQPNGENLLLEKEGRPDDVARIYDANTGAWDYHALGRLLYPDDVREAR